MLRFGRYAAVILLFSLHCSAQFLVNNINTFHVATSQPNCTSTPNSVSDPGWENQCDPGSGSCAGGIICGNIPLSTVSTAGTCGTVPDGQGRELDLSWTGSLDGGYIFHPKINSAGNGNLDTADTTWTWSGWFCYTDLSQIWRIEFDFYQIMTSSDVMIFAAQCNLSLNKWQFSNGWTLTSDIPCNKSGYFTANAWHHLAIGAHRCTNFVSGSPCNITYDWVFFDNATVNCTTNCTHDGRVSLNFAPTGGLLENVQLDPHTTGTGSMVTYADMMTTQSPEAIPNSAGASFGTNIGIGTNVGIH